MNRHAFTLLELLIVVAIIAILAAIGVVNLTEAQERALRSADAGNLHAIGVALQSYVVDYGKLPVGDQVAGPVDSRDARTTGNGPAAGGSWDGVPWALVDLKYLENWKTLFCPKYLKLYSGGKTIGGDFPRYHNFRYAYNSASNGSGGYSGGASGTNIMSGDAKSWIARDLFLAPDSGFYAASAPNYPADYAYPWGPKRDQELAIWADFGVRLVVGGTAQLPDANAK